ncbi:MAG: low-specificity L-threonine aldolase [Spirochaetes bacterium]|nr:low-specificity L-threonine aldolase [Spirochaetota bacterium]
MRTVDLRSDTVTEPTRRMRKSIGEAPVGDDVFGEDPTVRRLERSSSELVEKEAALFVPSGTMGNLISVLCHCQRGEEVILGDQSHIFLNETGGVCALGGVVVHTVPNEQDGTISIPRIEAAIRGSDIHQPLTKLICIENTHNRCSGAPISAAYTAEVCGLAQKRGLAVHLDGARLFNAACALKVDPKELARDVDSLLFCFSKGLAAPVGSVICGNREFIERARKVRKMLGGGMRQCGVIAAAGLVALEEMTTRLEEDHINARRLAEGIDGIPGLHVDTSLVKTNILYADLVADTLSCKELLDVLESSGVRILQTGPARFRMVTHYGIGAEDIDYAVETIRGALK